MNEEQPDRISVMIIEDHPIYREALRGNIEINEDVFHLVGCTDDVREAIAVVERTVPNVVLLDLELHKDTRAGIQAIQSIQATSPMTKVVVLTAHHENELVFPAIQAGAVTYLLKENVKGPDLSDILQKVHAGDPPVDPHIAKKLWAYFQEPEDAMDQLRPFQEKLTGREREVLQLIVETKSNREIADVLVVSEKTVKTHVSNILHKLHLSNRTELRMFAAMRFDKNASKPG